MRAMTWSFLTTELKSAKSSLTCPEIWDPTSTVMTALRVPVSETAEVSGPRDTAAVRKAERPRCPDRWWPPDDPAATTIPTIQSRRRFMMVRRAGRARYS
jgi:hypothetical protein